MMLSPAEHYSGYERAAPSASRQGQSAQDLVTDVTVEDVKQTALYLRKALQRAIDIRDRSPAGSYMENVLTKTIDGISLELAQLDYLLAEKPVEVPKPVSERRMRPAI